VTERLQRKARIVERRPSTGYVIQAVCVESVQKRTRVHPRLPPRHPLVTVAIALIALRNQISASSHRHVEKCITTSARTLRIEFPSINMRHSRGR
jgi:hypothetical protein